MCVKCSYRATHSRLIAYHWMCASKLLQFGNAHESGSRFPTYKKITTSMHQIIKIFYHVSLTLALPESKTWSKISADKYQHRVEEINFKVYFWNARTLKIDEMKTENQRQWMPDASSNVSCQDRTLKGTISEAFPTWSQSSRVSKVGIKFEYLSGRCQSHFTSTCMQNPDSSLVCTENFSNYF